MPFLRRIWPGRMGLGGIMTVIAMTVWHQAGRSEPTPPSPAMSKVEADGIIFERQQIMLQLDKDAKTLGQIAAGTLPTAKLAETTRSIAQAAKDSVPAFEQVVPGGRSKQEIWSNHTEFMRDMQDFATKAEAMAKAGEGGNLNAVTGLMIDALPCKQCHDRYRAPKPS